MRSSAGRPVSGGVRLSPTRGGWLCRIRAEGSVVPERLDDPSLREGVLPREACGVDAQEDFHAVSGPLGYLRRGHSPVEPRRDAGVPEVIGPLRERSADLLLRQCGLTGLPPCAPVGDRGQLAAPDAIEEPGVR